MADPATHQPEADAPAVSTVYGGGGVFGIAYNLGIAETFVDRGIDLGSAPSIGTSAGAWAAAHLALGLRFGDRFDQFAHDIPRRPDLRRDRLADLARAVFGETTRCPTVRVGVVAVPSLRRRMLEGADHPIAELVAASSAFPGMLAPHRIDGTRYIDGGIRSMASADLGDRAARLLVVLPMSGPMFGPAGRVLERKTVVEIETWQRLHPGSEVTVARPSDEIARLVRRPDQLFDPRIARECYQLAREQGAAMVAAWDGGGRIGAPARRRRLVPDRRRVGWVTARITLRHPFGATQGALRTAAL